MINTRRKKIESNKSNTIRFSGFRQSGSKSTNGIQIVVLVNTLTGASGDQSDRKIEGEFVSGEDL